MPHRCVRGSRGITCGGAAAMGRASRHCKSYGRSGKRAAASATDKVSAAVGGAYNGGAREWHCPDLSSSNLKKLYLTRSCHEKTPTMLAARAVAMCACSRIFKQKEVKIRNDKDPAAWGSLQPFLCTHTQSPLPRVTRRRSWQVPKAERRETLGELQAH